MLAVASALNISTISLSAFAASDIEDLRAIVNAQQDQIDALKQQTGATGMGKTHIGGYGELHYNNLDNQLDGGNDKKEIDFHRFVLFINHNFSDRIRLNSEFELEHSLAGEGQPGEVELEQAYIDFDLNSQHTVRAGLFLIPVGIINETHEPPTFYGAERNSVENNTIPATWWEGGVSMYGKISPALSYDVAITSGLDNDSYKIRSGRQKAAKAQAEDLAYTGRLKWTGMPGLELAATVQYQENITQGDDPDASATLMETHAVWQNGPFGLRALYATWQVEGEGAKAVGMDEQTGFYIEPSFKFSPNWGVFARYNQWDAAAGDETDSEYSQADFGVNFWPHEQIVIKADYQDQSAPVGKDELDGFNLAVGYQF
jgi:hypothetical protein